MPGFGSAFTGLANDRKITDEELIRAIRFMVASEYEATQFYMQIAESTNNKLAVKVLKEIADEELVHAGELLRLLRELAPDEEKLYAQGAREVEDNIEKTKQKVQGDTIQTTISVWLYHIFLYHPPKGERHEQNRFQ